MIKFHTNNFFTKYHENIYFHNHLYTINMKPLQLYYTYYLQKPMYKIFNMLSSFSAST